MKQIKADLIGVTGRNGLRGEFRQFQEESERRDQEVINTVHNMREQFSSWFKWTIGTTVTGVGVMFAALRLFF